MNRQDYTLVSRDAHSGDKIITKHKSSNDYGDPGMALRQNMWERLPEWLEKSLFLDLGRGYRSVWFIIMH